MLIVKTLALILATTLSCHHLSAEKKCVISTMPKTGSHLVLKILENLTGKSCLFVGPGQYNRYLEPISLVDQQTFNRLSANENYVPIWWYGKAISKNSLAKSLDLLEKDRRFLCTHSPFSEQYRDLLKSKNYVNFFVVRDLRDWACSSRRWIVETPSWRRHHPDWWFSLNHDEQLFYVIKGTRWYNQLAYLADVFLPWRDSETACVLVFEKLVGPGKGTCTAEEHLAELRKIATALEIDCTDDELLEAFQTAFGRGQTYRSSPTGYWHQQFKESHKDLFKSTMGNWLIDLGYETDNNW